MHTFCLRNPRSIFTFVDEIRTHHTVQRTDRYRYHPNKLYPLLPDQVAELEATLAKCQSEFEQATAEKLRCQQEAETTAKTIELANRLVGGLASENVRWAESINEYRVNEQTLAGMWGFVCFP